MPVKGALCLFSVICCGLVQIGVTHIIQDYFTWAGTPVAGKQSWSARVEGWGDHSNEPVGIVNINTIKQWIAKPCAYFMQYTANITAQETIFFLPIHLNHLRDLCSLISQWIRKCFCVILTQWGRWVSIHTSIPSVIIGSDNGMSPARCQAIIWTNAALLSIRPWGIKVSEFVIESETFSFKNMRLKISSAKLRTSCLGLNVLINKKYLDQFDSEDFGVLISPGTADPRYHRGSLTQI